MRKPAAAKPMPPPGLAPTTALAAAGLPGGLARGGTVLVVEDDQALRELLRLTLQSRDFHVLVAADGAEALRIAERQALPISLLVSDVMMPGMAGPELARRLAARCAGLKVLLLSGYPRDAARLDPQVAFLQKPFQPRALLAAVRAMLSVDAGQAG
jgi:two-component system cell cycle sensor histidine kinase/response regulator CckA